jgi:hypothetical protein
MSNKHLTKKNFVVNCIVKIYLKTYKCAKMFLKINNIN